MWPFSQKILPQEIKSTITDVDISSGNNVYMLLMGESVGEPINIQPKDCYYLVERNADLGSAVHRISGSIAGLRLAVYNEDDEPDYEHDLITLLNRPGDGKRGLQFLNEVAESFLVTNEIWIVARGNINRPPLSLVFIRPFDVAVTFDSNDGLPLIIETQSTFDRRTYSRNTVNGQMRFFDATKLNELIPIVGLTNLTDGWRGRSPLSKLFYDVKMNTDGKRHNVSMLLNGARISAMLSPKGTNSQGGQLQWSEKSVEMLEKKFRGFYQGSGNAGNVFILSQPGEMQTLMQSNVDMDFLNLLKVSRESIYNLFQIPLPLIMSDAMTLDNYKMAQKAYYMKAVFPVFNNIADGIVNGLYSRYNFEDGDYLGYSEVDIPDMRELLVDNMVALKNTESVTVNEVRNIGGYEDDPEGDVILISAAKTPLESITEKPSFEDMSGEIPPQLQQEKPEDIFPPEMIEEPKHFDDVHCSMVEKMASKIKGLEKNLKTVDTELKTKRMRIKKTINYKDIDGNEKQAEITEEEL